MKDFKKQTEQTKSPPNGRANIGHCAKLSRLRRRRLGHVSAGGRSQLRQTSNRRQE